MENDKLNNDLNTEFNNGATKMENDSNCCGGSSPCCVEDEVSSTYESKATEVKATEAVSEKSSGGCGCGCNC